MFTPTFISPALIKNKPPIHLITCKDPQGRDCYYFIATTEEKISEMAALQDGTHQISDYGKILGSGFGTKPSEAVKQMIKEKHGYDVSAA